MVQILPITCLPIRLTSITYLFISPDVPVYPPFFVAKLTRKSEWHHQAMWVLGSPPIRWKKGETAPLPSERNERQNITHRYWLDYERLMKSINESGWSHKLLTWG